MNGPIGAPIVRSDARAKVTGAARFPADERPGPETCHAALTVSSVARGRILELDTAAAEAVPGVRLVMTHRSPEARYTGQGITSGGAFQSSANPLGSPEIHHAGQIVALCVADTVEAAEEAAHLVRVTYREEPSRATLEQALERPEGPGGPSQPAGGASGPGDDDEAGGGHSIEVGDTTSALRAAPVVVAAEYRTPAMHHHPMELYTATAVWEDDQRLTLHAPVQWLVAHQRALAAVFGLRPEAVRVASRYVGGGFGGKASVLWHLVLVASAARRLGRPVKLVVSRPQMSTVGSFRPQSLQRVTLGATEDGRLLGYEHRGWGQTSRVDTLLLPGAETTTRLYACPAIRTRETAVPTDVNTPGFMRAPAEYPASFALESAMDELAHRLRMDPVELRLRNEPDADPVTGLPFSSRSLVACYRRGAELFGWSGRDGRVGRMRDERGWLVGWGCASSAYPVMHSPSRARVSLTADGRAEVLVGAHDLGTGAATVLAQVGAQALGLEVSAVTARVGGSDLPAGPLAGGSGTTGSAGSAVWAAGRAARRRLLLAAAASGPPAWRDPDTLRIEDGVVHGPDGTTRPLGAVVATLEGGRLDVTEEWAPAGLTPAQSRAALDGSLYQSGAVGDTHVQFSWGAQFVEVRVDPDTRRVRLGRMVGVFACGRVVNPRTVRGQLAGGMIWGAGHALLEEAPIDPRRGRFTTPDLGGYHLATHADVGEVTVETVQEHDEVVNPLGVKGVGELGIVGTAAAVANAVHHATGVRVRKTPVLLDDLLLDDPPPGDLPPGDLPPAD